MADIAVRKATLSERLDEVAAGGVLRGADLLQFSSLKTVTPRASELPGAVVERIGSFLRRLGVS